MKTCFYLSLLQLFIFFFFCSISAKIEGFYKDVFQDEGTQINGSDMKIDCQYIGYSMEHLDTETKTPQDEIMIKNANDANGYLLYPDGEPRFAIIYYHGGMMGHATDLGTEGRQRVRDHYYHGGSQFGSCAGSYMLSSSSTNYFRIWPGKMNGPNISNTRVDKIINAGSPLVKYLNFKVGEVITGVYHNNGGSVDTNKTVKGTVICSMHNSETLKGYADIWSWKDNDTTGRALGSTGHPEGNTAEAQKRYMGAFMLYLTDGLGRPDIKNQLVNGQPITMNKETADNNPKLTKIGDKQYHHFLICLKSGAKNIKITLDGTDGYDFHLFAAKDTFAFKQSADFIDTSAGSDKTLNIQQTLSACSLFVGVKLNTTVTSNQTSLDFARDYSRELLITYSGKLEVLNGIGYSIQASWEDGVSLSQNSELLNSQRLAVTYLNRQILIRVNQAEPYSVQVFDMRGRICWQPKISAAAGTMLYTWKPDGAGMYIVRLASGKTVINRRITIAK